VQRVITVNVILPIDLAGLAGVFAIMLACCVMAWVIREATRTGYRGEEVEGGVGTWTRLREAEDDDF
jgi:hypothetical protein